MNDDANIMAKIQKNKAKHAKKYSNLLDKVNKSKYIDNPRDRQKNANRPIADDGGGCSKIYWKIKIKFFKGGVLSKFLPLNKKPLISTIF